MSAREMIWGLLAVLGLSWLVWRRLKPAVALMGFAAVFGLAWWWAS